MSLIWLQETVFCTISITIVIWVTALGIINKLISTSLDTRSEKDRSYSIYSTLFECKNNFTYSESREKLKMLLLLSFKFLIISTAENRGIYSRRLILSLSYAGRLSLSLTQVPSSRYSTILSRCSAVAPITANAIRFILGFLSYSLISSKVCRLHIGTRSLSLRVNNVNLIR